MVQMAEPKFGAEGIVSAPRKGSSLVGLLKNLISYDPRNPDHDPVRPVRGHRRDPEIVALSKQIDTVLRRRDQGDLMDAGGWMDIHTGVFHPAESA